MDFYVIIFSEQSRTTEVSWTFDVPIITRLKIRQLIYKYIFDVIIYIHYLI